MQAPRSSRSNGVEDQADRKRHRVPSYIEKQKGLGNLLEAAVQVRERAEDGSIGNGRTTEQWLLAANVLIDCPLPFRPTSARQVSRRTRFHDAFVTITFTAHRPGVALPTATDSRVLHWLLNKVVQEARAAQARGEVPSCTVQWKSAYEYLTDAGKTICANNYKDLRESLSRISGLSITLERHDHTGDLGIHTAFLDSWYLPSSLDPSSKQSWAGVNYAVALSEAIVRTATEHFVAIPTAIWKLTKGRPLQGCLLMWLYKRAHTSAAPSIVPWNLLKDQFGLEDSNPRRIKPLTKRMVTLLQAMWPGCGVQVLSSGIRFSQQTAPFLQRSIGRGDRFLRKTKRYRQSAPE